MKTGEKEKRKKRKTISDKNFKQITTKINVTSKCSGECYFVLRRLILTCPSFTCPGENTVDLVYAVMF